MLVRRPKVNKCITIVSVLLCLLLYRIGRSVFTKENQTNYVDVIEIGVVDAETLIRLVTANPDKGRDAQPDGEADGHPIVTAGLQPDVPDVQPVSATPRGDLKTTPAEQLHKKDPKKDQPGKILSRPGKDLIETATLPPSWNASGEIINRLAARRQHVKEICQRDGLDKPDGKYQMNAWEFLINKEHNLIWCNVFKAASSTWMWNFNLLAGYKEEDLLKSRKAPVELARAHYPRPTVKELELALKSSPRPLAFMITKHPLLRLVSAYRNKILNGNAIYVPLFKKIFAKYKQYGPPVPRMAKNGVLTLMQGKTAPSFSQFVQYILDKEKDRKQLDMHWVPQSRFCTPCLVDFDVFAKTETLDEDGNYIIFTSGINKYIQPKVINRSVAGSTEEAARELLCQLTPQQFEGLLKLYKYDLELFEYDAAIYREACSSS